MVAVFDWNTKCCQVAHRSDDITRTTAKRHDRSNPMKCKRLLIEPGCWNASLANFHSLPKRLRGETIVDTHKNSETTTDHNCGNLLSLLELFYPRWNFYYFSSSLFSRACDILFESYFFGRLGGEEKKEQANHTPQCRQHLISQRGSFFSSREFEFVRRFFFISFYFILDDDDDARCVCRKHTKKPV